MSAMRSLLPPIKVASLPGSATDTQAVQMSIFIVWITLRFYVVLDSSRRTARTPTARRSSIRRSTRDATCSRIRLHSLKPTVDQLVFVSFDHVGDALELLDAVFFFSLVFLWSRVRTGKPRLQLFILRTRKPPFRLAAVLHPQVGALQLYC